MTFTTAQAAKALSIAPATMRKHREHKGMGKEIVPGRTAWTIEELEQLKRDQGWRKPQWLVKFTVTQLKGPKLNGSMVLWGPSEAIIEAKAGAWFWNAELKAYPKLWGVPVQFTVVSIKEQIK